jgi:hypothetical protein
MQPLLYSISYWSSQEAIWMVSWIYEALQKKDCHASLCPSGIICQTLCMFIHISFTYFDKAVCHQISIQQNNGQVEDALIFLEQSKWRILIQTWLVICLTTHSHDSFLWPYHTKLLATNQDSERTRPDLDMLQCWPFKLKAKHSRSSLLNSKKKKKKSW